MIWMINTKLTIKEVLLFALLCFIKLLCIRANTMQAKLLHNGWYVFFADMQTIWDQDCANLFRTVTLLAVIKDLRIVFWTMGRWTETTWNIFLQYFDGEKNFASQTCWGVRIRTIFSQWRKRVSWIYYWNRWVWRAKKLYIKPCEVIKLFWSKSRCSPLFNASLFQERGVAKISISA